MYKLGRIVVKDTRDYDYLLKAKAVKLDIELCKDVTKWNSQ
jgi:hypothetical protein